MAGDTVFLTGGSGFLGAHVARALLASGHRVRALVRSEAGRARLPEGCEPVDGTLERPGALVRDLDGCRYLVHVAAVYSFGPRLREQIELVNVRGTAGLLEAARRAGVERAVVTSSSAAAGPARGSRPAVEEDWADATAGGHGAYHGSKLRQERAALAARLPVVTVLPTAPVGAGDWRPTPTGRMVLDYMRGRMFAYLPGGMNVVSAADAALGHVLALDAGTPGHRYLLGGENLTLLEIFQALAEITGVPAPARELPSWVAQLTGHLDAWRCRLTGREEPSVPLEGVDMGRRLMWVSSDRARVELGYAPRQTAAEALQQAVDWFRAHGYPA